MRRKDFAVVLGVAAATAAVILTVCRPQVVSAEDEEGGMRQLIKRPSLRTDGVVLTLESVKDKYEVGEKPAVKLTAVNAASEPRTVNVTLRMMTTAPASFLYRRMPIPTEAWSRTCPISLKAGETRMIPISADVALPAGKSIFFTMDVGKKSAKAAPLAIPYLAIKTVGGPAAPGGAVVLQDVNLQNTAKIMESGGK